MKGWDGEFYCDFGQVNSKHELNGIARIVNEKGTVLEGQFKNNTFDGWFRVIFWDDALYAIGWFQEGQYNGYWKRVNAEHGAVKFEGLLENDTQPKLDKDIPKDKNTLYAKQKTMMKDHKTKYFGK